MNSNGPNRLPRREELPCPSSVPPSQRARGWIMSNMRLRRICSALIDLQLVNLPCGLIMLIALRFSPENAVVYTEAHRYYRHPALAALFLILMLLKDIVRSPGKRIMKLELTDSGESVPVWKRILRNITVIIWPVEAVVLLVSGRRITDRVLKLDVTGARKANGAAAGN